MPGGNSEWEPPDPISNSEVKPLSADDSVGSPHVKVGHCQASIQNPGLNEVGVFLYVKGELIIIKAGRRSHASMRLAT